MVYISKECFSCFLKYHPNSFDSDPDGLSWIITFRTDISDAELKSLPDTIYWNMFGAGSTIVFPATSSPSIPKAFLKMGQIKLAKPKFGVAQTILTQQDGRLVFGTSPQEAVLHPRFTMEIGDICHKSPEYFSNLTNNLKCFEVREADVGL
jgi:hypothetical protein